MDDPWSTNAWSTEDSDKEDSFQINHLAPKWETSENNAEFYVESGNTLDPSLPSSSSWTIPSESAWDVGNDVWNTNVNTSYNKPWNSRESTVVSTQTIPETVEEPSEKPADLETVRPALPTPPSSPLAIPHRITPEILEKDVQTLDVPEPSEMPTALATPDHFGSFESAQEAKPVAYSDGETFWSKETVFKTEDSFEEPWKSTWESPVDEDAVDSQPKDDWEVAQETHRKINEKIPQELLRLIISRWEAIVEEHYSQYVLPGELDYSWRKGLDNVPGLSERIDNFIPSSYFSLPTPFPKSQIAKTVKDSLHLSRSYVLSQSSPMAQFYASKSSLEWENSVKMQKSAANDEWGWDLKQVTEETLEAQETGKEPEKKGGFLSFWKRRTASESTTATSNTQPEPPQPEKKEQTPAVPVPTSSLRPSFENLPSTPSSPKVPLESTVSPTTEITTDYDQPPQPSVVSRFFNRLSRRPASGIIVETTEHSPSSASVSLSADDLAFLSDVVPSDPKPKLSSSVHKSSGSTGSLGDVLSFSTAKKDQLPKPLAPPPNSSRILPATEGFKKKVKQGVDVIDLLGDDLMSSPSSVDRMPHLGGAKLLFEDISIFENKPSIPEQKPSTTLDLSPIPSSSRVHTSTPPNLQQPPPQLLHPQPRASSSSSRSAASIPPPPSKFGHSKPSVSHSVVSSSISQSFDDFSDFISGHPNHIKSTTTPLVFDNNDTNDFGDFGEFVSTPQFSQQHELHSNSKAQAESFGTKGDFRGSSSVTIPILKPPPKFTTVGSDSISRNTDKNRLRSPPLTGKSSPLPPQPRELRPSQILQQQTASASLPSIGKTASTASSLNKSGLSAHDLSFFEDNIPKELPTPGINWTPCGDNIECGRLTVPLDYHNTSAGVANLALARYLATNKTGYLGSILTNPGGPGGSGVNYIYRAGKRLSDTVDGRYDIVSWDPRGINESLPRVECFDSQTAQDLFYAHTSQEMSLEWRNLSDPTDRDSFIRSVRRSDANNAALAKLCAEKSGEALRHVGTATVVRDIEFINNIIQGESEPINFWGFSYGTVIGSYLVNMFPDKIGRVVIDGVVDPELWANSYSSEWYKDDFIDTDKAFNNFLEACQTAGSTRCALADEKSTARSIGQAIDNFLDALYDYPLTVTEANRPGILTSGMVKGSTITSSIDDILTTLSLPLGAIFTAMYAPRNWPPLAEKLAQAIKGNGTALMNDILTKIELNTSIKPQTAQAITAVTCVDTPPYPDTADKSVYLDQYIEEVVLTFETTSKRFAALDLDLCHHWVPREVERFTGPFNSSLSNPILVVGNTADPITPGVNARRVNELLKNSSRLVIQDGSGHCSSAMASLCTGKVLRGYWLQGELPPNGIICPTSELLFPPSSDSGVLSLWVQDDVRDPEDLRILENMRFLGEAVQPFLIESRK